MTLTEISYMCLELLRSGHVVDDERLEDTVKDMINYSVYLVMMNRGKLECQPAQSNEK